MPGFLKDYHVDLFDLTPALSGASASAKKYRILLQANETSYALNMSAPFALKIRVIPRTRALLPPPEKLDSVKKFGYTLISAVEEQDMNVDWTVLPAAVRFHQMGKSPRIEVGVEYTPDVGRVSLLALRYRPLNNLLHPERFVWKTPDRGDVRYTRAAAPVTEKVTVVLEEGLRLVSDRFLSLHWV